MPNNSFSLWQRIKNFFWSWTPTWIKNRFWPDWNQNPNNSLNQNAPEQQDIAEQELQRSLSIAQEIRQSPDGSLEQNKSLQNKSNPEIVSPEDFQAIYKKLCRAIQDQSSQEIKEICESNIRDSESGYTFLHKAVFFHKEVVLALIKYGADINATDNRGQTPLHIVASRGNAEIRNILLQAGPDLNVLDNEGRTPLGIAMYEEKSHHIKPFLDNGADINKEFTIGELTTTPLSYATIDKPEMIDILFKYQNLDLNLADNHGWTALHHAAEMNRTETIKALLHRGSDPAKTNPEGERPIDLTTDAEVRNILLEAQREISEREKMLAEDKWQNRISRKYIDSQTRAGGSSDTKISLPRGENNSGPSSPGSR